MNTPPRILFIVTSHARLGDTGKPTGLWAEELAEPWLAFDAAGWAIELASPQGGPVPFDPGSLPAPDQRGGVVGRFLDHPVAREQVRQTRTVASVHGADYDAVFLPGGHGTMWDTATDPGVCRAVEAAWAAGRLVAAVCHGPAGLVAARDAQGRPLVQGRRVSAFTNAEEDAVGLSGVVPFALETRLRELGARFESVPNWQPLAVRDGQLVTGQNPQSSAAVTAAVLQAFA